MKRIDFTNPATIKAAASFPFYGQAETLIRQIDPLWKVSPDVEHDWSLRFERDECDCNCPHCDWKDIKRLTVAACTAEQAEEEARRQIKNEYEWECVSVVLNEKRDVPFPDWIYDIAGGEQ